MVPLSEAYIMVPLVPLSEAYIMVPLVPHSEAYIMVPLSEALQYQVYSSVISG